MIVLFFMRVLRDVSVSPLFTVDGAVPRTSLYIYIHAHVYVYSRGTIPGVVSATGVAPIGRI